MVEWITQDDIAIPFEVVDTSRVNWRYPSGRRSGVLLMDLGWKVVEVKDR
jgi:hypothetical protein